jgi:hypothetical protein
MVQKSFLDDNAAMHEKSAGFQPRMPTAFFGPGGTEQMPFWVC